MKKSAPSRIIFTNSIGCFFTLLKLEDLDPRENYPNPYKIYLKSKLFLAVAAKHFASKLRDSNVTVNSFHPGAARSGIFLKAVNDEISLYPIVLGLLTIPFGKVDI